MSPCHSACTQKLGVQRNSLDTNIKLEWDALWNHGALRARKVGQRQLIDPQADRAEIRPMIRVLSLSLPVSALFLGPGEVGRHS